MTPSSSSRTPALLGGASGLALALALAAPPAEAHGIAGGGLAAGFLHPLQGVDHLLLLLAVGTVAAAISPRLLLWSLAGAAAGGVYGSLGGALPGQELLAAIAISALGLLVLASLRARRAPHLGVCGGLVAGAVAIHAMLHGLEAPSGGVAAWWLGAVAASLLVSGSSYALLRRLPSPWIRGTALLLALLGGGLSLGLLGGGLAG